MLPYGIGDAIVVEEEEELFLEDTGEGEGDVAKEHIGGAAVALVSVEDVGDEGVGGVEGLAARLAGALRRGEEVVFVSFGLELAEEALLPSHVEDVAQGDTAVVDGVERVKGGSYQSWGHCQLVLTFCINSTRA